MDKIRLVIASDNSSARRGLTAIFNAENVFMVQGDYTLGEVVDKSISLQPDTILLDMPDGVAVDEREISRIKKECPCSLVMALVENEPRETVAEILKWGIDGCIPRGIMRSCLVNTVELACRAGILCLPGSFKKIVSGEKTKLPNYNGGGRINKYDNGNNENLTRREMEILQLMANNYSNREIATQLFISEPTVKTHVSSILRKLGQNNRAQAIVYSFKNGLVDNVHMEVK